ncbi:MAG: L,D-transpeptidase [Pyrinomonadaceae bacterium]|nr:L,D-transpeptidase [Pyrinomonadaceae bacterium]
MRSAITIVFSLFLLTVSTPAQSYILDMARQSARSDTRTGGSIEKAKILANNSNLKLTVNVPSFKMTLWQEGKEVRTYYVGVGLKDYPIFVGLRKIDTVIFNPAWIPPHSKWVAPSLRGKVIGPSDPRNPLGKMKIPLGYGYLLHQAKSTRDQGSLVSHGCVRVLRNDLYDLNDKFLIAQGMDLTKEVTAAKRNRRTFVIELEEPVNFEVTYDAIVVENKTLHIYPDVYGYRKDMLGDLRKELKANGVDESSIADADLKAMIAKAKRKKQFVIALEDIQVGEFSKGKVVSVVPKPKPKRRRKR